MEPGPFPLVVMRPDGSGQRRPTPYRVGTLVVALALSVGVAPVRGEGGTVASNAHGLVEWLEEGEYQRWIGESSMHPSAGPHFGQVKVFVNSVLAHSLDEGRRHHSAGAAAVKELFGNGQTVRGWAVALKLSGMDRVLGAGRWYWFEFFDGQAVTNGPSVKLCEGCHQSGHDMFLSDWPRR